MIKKTLGIVKPIERSCSTKLIKINIALTPKNNRASGFVPSRISRFSIAPQNIKVNTEAAKKKFGLGSLFFDKKNAESMPSINSIFQADDIVPRSQLSVAEYKSKKCNKMVDSHTQSSKTPSLKEIIAKAKKE